MSSKPVLYSLMLLGSFVVLFLLAKNLDHPVTDVIIAILIIVHMAAGVVFKYKWPASILSIPSLVEEQRQRTARKELLRAQATEKAPELNDARAPFPESSDGT